MASRAIVQMVDILRICTSNPSTSLTSCMAMLQSDLDYIWACNSPVPPAYSFCMHEQICRQAAKLPEKKAISSWDGDLTYSQVDRYSTILGSQLQSVSDEKGQIVGLCFEKSKWASVAVLAVMKSGNTFVLMDPSLPVARLQTMAAQVNAKTIVTSSLQTDLSASILPDGRVVVVQEAMFAESANVENIFHLDRVDPSTLMYIIFTSGSTGIPKGVKISHKTYTSSAIPRSEAVGYTSSSRVLDFAAYAFDVSIDSMLLTLGNGGCLCIPSDEARMNDINQVMRDMRVTYAGLTPSVARILDPDIISSLAALGLGGTWLSFPYNAQIMSSDSNTGYAPVSLTKACIFSVAGYISNELTT